MTNNQETNNNQWINNQLTKQASKFDLEARTLLFAKEIAVFCKKLPKDITNNEYIKQLIRSGSSVGANYREANDALGKKDFSHRIRICRKEAKESQYWLELIIDSNPDCEREAILLLDESIELKKIFSSIAGKCS